LSLVQVASSLPFFLLAIPSGALADVVDRRRLALVALGWLGAAAALLSALTFAGQAGPSALLALTFALGIGSALSDRRSRRSSRSWCRATRSSPRCR